MTNLDPEEELKIYQKRMKIEQAFKDLRSLLCIDRLMNKQQIYMEQMIAMVLIAYCIGLMVGEKIRDILSGGEGDVSRDRRRRRKNWRNGIKSRKWKQYSGWFILRKHKIQLSEEAIEKIVNEVLEIFKSIVRGFVRGCV
ncbi:MAG: hypothetical protein A2Z14_02070 [Chloroflexi bacterium RBG_16_48_8]|nr:MAG: hypothetical protein A2Z14_02070 [Chloroflexi bacterium RBG_16_48_8]